MSDLYDLPDGWGWKKLGELCTFVRGPFGGSLKKQIFKESGNAVYEQSHAIYNQFEKIRYFIDDEKFEEMKRFELKSNSLIMSCSGTIGKVAIVPENIKKGIINQALLMLTPNESLNNLFLKLMMESNFFQTLLSENSTGAAIANVASVKVLKELKIPLPPLSEQQRIVSKLDNLFEKIDKAISLHQKNMDEADVFMGSVLNDVFGELEEKNHPMLRFDTYTNLSRGHNPPKKDFIYEEKDGYIRFIQIRDGSSDDNAVYVPITKKLHLVTKEDLLLVAYRQVGKVFRNMEGAFNVALCKIENNNYKNLDTNYLYYLIQSKYVKEELLSRSERALIPSMSIDHLKSLEIPTPTLQIQQKVVSYLDEISQKMEKIKQIQREKMESLKALKASILDQAFRGEL
jgi:type I restriction enzyme, S subunit